MADLTCDNCEAERGADDIFCESCGLDFLSGSLPEPEGTAAKTSRDPEVSTAEVATAEATTVKNEAGSASGPKLHISVEVDRAQYDKVVKESEVNFPDPVPPVQTLELAGDEFHIGRRSESRAIHPDLDILELTGDEAVSSRHAVIKIAGDGSHTVSDVGSTNGTTIGKVDNNLIAEGKVVLVEPGTAIFVGAWTKLTILARETS